MTPAPRWMRRPPDCRRVARVLQSHLDGELPEVDHRVVAEHLRHCDRCGIEARVYHDVKRALRGLAPVPDRQALARLRASATDMDDGGADHRSPVSRPRP